MAKNKANSKTKEELNELNEVGTRKKSSRRAKKSPAQSKTETPVVERRKVKRRRQIDPTTCEREYSDCEIEFMQAMDEYKRASGRMFPTCSEILEVLINMGYRRVADPQELYNPDSHEGSDEQNDESVSELEKEFA